ncbi:ABC transporter substrate-binding protein [Streptomyces cavernae]|uniref:ABC transporter substrate-binding protein n=1 Tax=Streptomyces cavernae TaxID=2259034 RepID=UPI000FEB679F|nr:ABC transporter substrate-binding protein [Streptomyces cavernae]
MTGRRHIPTSRPVLSRTARVSALAVGALVTCVALVAGCGAVPGVTGGSGDDSITVMTLAPENTAATNKPGMPALAKAYARWVNSQGGIAGRPLKVLTCNDQNDSVAAAHCAERAVEEKVLAVVGSYSQYGRDVLSPLQGAGIPFIGGYGVTDAEFSSPLSYPINGGQPALLAGLGRQLAKQCGPVTLVRPDTVAGDQLPVLIDAGLKKERHPEAVDLLAAEDATSYSNQAQQALVKASSNPQRTGCVVAALGDRTATFMDSFRRTQEDFPSVRTASVLGSIDQSVIDATGGKSGPYEGSYVTGWYPVSSDARWDQMRAVIKKEAFGDNRIDPTDVGVQTTWIAYTVLKKTIESLGDGDVSSSAVRRVLDDGLKISTGGLTPTLRWRFEDMLADSDFPRLINAKVTFQTVRSGKLTAQGRGFVDMAPTLEQSD